jgi:hypothetical protein
MPAKIGVTRFNAARTRINTRLQSIATIVRANGELFAQELYGTRRAEQRVRVHRLRLGSSLVSCAFALSQFGCASGAAFDTRLASDFAPAHHTVSVLGVYKDGRMALGSWDTLGPYFRRALGTAPCSIYYDALVSSNQDLANAIDEYARDEGPTGNLLTQIAPAAQGDLILVVSFSGKLPDQKRRDAPPPTAAPVQNNMATQRRRRHHDAEGENVRDDNYLDISASLFSVARKKAVALISMKYRGESIADALGRFATELANALPEARCSGWNSSVSVDPQSIRPPLEVPSEPQ